MTRIPEIFVSIGPTLERPEDLRRAIEAGARGFRLPCGYRQRPHLENARAVRAAAAECGVQVQLMLDVPASRPRTGKMDELRLPPGARVRFRDADAGPVPPQEPGVFDVPLHDFGGMLSQVAPGHRLWFCDGCLEFRADEIVEGTLLAHLVRGTIPLKASNSIFLPDDGASFTMVAPEDRVLWDSLAAEGLTPDWVAFSLVSSAQDVRAGREDVRRHFTGTVRVMAKIETAAAMDRLDSILAEADGIMVARGDLGLAVEFIGLPEAEERLVRAGRQAGKPVVVATQILEIFAEVGVPLRAELSGLAMLAQEGPDAILLCKETVYSPRPIEAIRFARAVLTYECERREREQRSAGPMTVPHRVPAEAGDQLVLLSGNPKKYAPFRKLLEEMGIVLRVPEFPLAESQGEDFLAVLERKARLAYEALGGPCLVDDSGLVLDAYPCFPGPQTASVCRLLGGAGLERLLAGVSHRARMVCYLGCWVEGKLWHWHGEISGTLDPRRPAGEGAGPLTQWFLPDEPGKGFTFQHRARALEALGRDLNRLRQAIGLGESVKRIRHTPCADRSGIPTTQAWCPVPTTHPACVFCNEFDGQSASIFHDLTNREIPSRIVQQTDRFLVFPPLGQFVEGGLLLATREHWISMAALPGDYYDELERLMTETSELLLKHYGCRPLFFEHAPVSPGDKGTCCVDHAHLNIFPVQVDVHQHLRKFPHERLSRMCELGQPRYHEQAYLFLQDNDGNRFAYKPGIVPSQHVRKIITTTLGMPDRWHWREYLGVEELKRTLAKLAGWKAEG